MIDFERMLRTLAQGEVEFIVVGGAAARAHGSARLTQDLDVVYARGEDNLERLARALEPYAPYLRGAPAGLPFRLDPETLRRGLNFTLVTTIGDLDVLGEIAGGGTYAALLPDTVVVEAFGVRVRCLSLERLLRAKRDAGRPKDLEAIAELEALREERDRPGSEDA